jgi:hypothetical protein
VRVRHTRSGRIVALPADYVSTATELGYATTVHAAQGVTADTMHGVVTGDESRQQLYTMLTRGRSANHVYPSVVGDGDSACGYLARQPSSSYRYRAARTDLGTRRHRAIRHDPEARAARSRRPAWPGHGALPRRPPPRRRTSRRATGGRRPRPERRPSDHWTHRRASMANPTFPPAASRRCWRRSDR